MEAALVFGLALFLSLAQFAGFWSEMAFHKRRFILISLSAGMFTVVLFMDMLRQMHAYYGVFGSIVLAFLLFGFALFHALQKSVYQRTQPGSRKRALGLAELDMTAALLEDFGLGFLFALLVLHLGSGLPVYLLFLPFLLRAFAASVFLSKAAEHFSFGWLQKAALCLPIFLGAVLAYFLQLEEMALALTFSFLIGALFYIITREMIPRGRQGELNYYFLGLALGLIAFYLSA